jgi:hypothetical protein
MSTSSVKFDAFNHIFNTFVFINHMINNKEQYNILNLETDSNKVDSNEVDSNEVVNDEVDNKVDVASLDNNDIFMLISESNFCSDLSIGIISVGHIMLLLAFCITSNFVFSFVFYYTSMVGRYVFNLIWNSLDKGQELPQLITIIIGLTIYTYIMCSANSCDEQFNLHINKLKSEIAEKNYIIAELQTKVDQLLSEISDYDDTVWETVSESSSDDEDLQ